MHGFLEQLPEALEAARKAVEADPNDYHLHYMLGVRLYQQGELDESLEQFRWCLRRRPDDKAALQKLSMVKDRRLMIR